MKRPENLLNFKFLFLQGFAAVGEGGTAEIFTDEPDERGELREAAPLCNFADGEVRSEQQNLRLLKPPVADVTSGGEPHFFFEQTRKRAAGDAESVADHVQVEVAVGELAPDQFHTLFHEKRGVLRDDLRRREICQDLAQNA